MRLFLLHGMGRTVASMLILAGRLQREGHRISLFGYSVAREELGTIAERFADHVEQVLAEAAGDGGEPPQFAVIGHSLGNVVVRLSLPQLPPGLTRLVMLAPPTRSPLSARTLEPNALFRLLTGDAGEKLVDPEFFASLPQPEVPTLVVAGTGGPRVPWLPFRGRPNDGVLLVEETRLAGGREMRVDGLHTFLMNRRDVGHAVSRFLDEGGADLAP